MISPLYYIGNLILWILYIIRKLILNGWIILQIVETPCYNLLVCTHTLPHHQLFCLYDPLFGKNLTCGEWHYLLWSHCSLLTSSLTSHFFTYFRWLSKFLSNHWHLCLSLTYTTCPNKYLSLMGWMTSIWFDKTKVSIKTIARVG